jgi:hypothetical protein
MKNAFFAALMLALPGIALAQVPPPISSQVETVYSEAQRARDEDLSRRLVQSLLRPSVNLEGQFTRWKTPICPRIVGLTPTAAHVVDRRIRDIATQVGAPVNRTDPCHPNIVILVTPTPQETLDDVAKADFMLVASARSKDRMAVKHPVQAYYFGLYRDFKGRTFWDMDWEFYLDEPPRVAAKMTRISTGIKAEIGVATIIVDANAIAGLTLGSVGDYLGLMALAQTPATGRCQPAPSIANLFLKECATDVRSDSLSDVDLAMLTSLYQASEEPERLQVNRLLMGMTRYLEGAHGK